MKRRYKYASIIIFLIAMVALTLIALPLVNSIREPEKFKNFIDKFGVLGIFVMLFIQIAQIIVALIPGEFVEFVAGSMYGWLGGLLICLAGIAIGQIIIFKMVKTFGREFVEAAAGSKVMNRFKFLNDEKKLKTVIFFLFFLPGTPKDLITYAVPFTPITLRNFIWLTLVARIPSVVSSTYAGDAFIKSNIKTLIIAYSLIAVISLIGIFIYKIYEKAQKKKNAIDSEITDNKKEEIPEAQKL